jgi:transposase-like protein
MLLQYAVPSKGKVGHGTIVIHCRKRPRYQCKTCGRTFSAKAGTALEGLRKPTELIVLVLTRLSYGCPLQAIVHEFHLDERTVANWRDRAGKHCETVHQAIVEQGKLDLMHVQADAHSGQSTRNDCLGVPDTGRTPLTGGKKSG